MPIDECRIIELPRVEDYRGNLAYIESNKHVPFEIKRVYYIYDIPSAALRGAHGHKNLEQLVIAMSGSFTVTLDDSENKKVFHLNNPGYGLYIPPMIWRDIDNFSSGSVCMVLASEFFDENDYYRDYGEFVKSSKGS